MRNTAGAIIVNAHGQRFVDETLFYESLSIACWTTCLRCSMKRGRGAFPLPKGRLDPLGETKALKPIETPPSDGIKIKLGHLATRGGLKINEKAQVLDLADNPIPGLYAAGEVTGGVFGGGYIGGGFLAEATVLGRVAGAQGAIDVLSR